ncbi:MAG TPA: hypothetical protein VFU63_08130 [Ktedonobacterales bacterium]|nr:hypothetical protein [Ktedonobacterales bacterium]
MSSFRRNLAESLKPGSAVGAVLRIAALRLMHPVEHFGRDIVEHRYLLGEIGPGSVSDSHRMRPVRNRRYSDTPHRPDATHAFGDWQEDDVAGNGRSPDGMRIVYASNACSQRYFDIFERTMDDLVSESYHDVVVSPLFAGL